MKKKLVKRFEKCAWLLSTIIQVTVLSLFGTDNAYKVIIILINLNTKPKNV